MAARDGSERGAARANTRLSRRAFVERMVGLGAATLLASCSEQTVSPSPTPRLRRVGYLTGSNQVQFDSFSPPFLQQLRDFGYVDGRDLEVVVRIGNNDLARTEAMAVELVALQVDVILADAGNARDAAKRATQTIPIVFTLGADPVAEGLIASLSRPGGNVTGVTTDSIQLAAKRVEVLKETLPGLRHLAILWNANNLRMPSQVSATEQAARVLGIETQALGLHNPAETDAALESLARQRPDGLLMLPTLSVIRSHQQVPELTAKIQLPAIYSEVDIVRAGGLMHRSADYADGHRRAARLVDKILKGANPADLPVEQPTQFLFAVNLIAARRIGLTIPDSVLRQATVVVR